MIRRRRLLLLLGLLTPLAAIGLLLSPAGQLHGLRPLAEALLAHHTGAAVRIEQLRLDWQRFQLDGLRLVFGPRRQVDIPSLSGRWSWQGLYQRRLDRIDLKRPRLTWTMDDAPPGSIPLPPTELPRLAVKALSIQDGTFALQQGPYPLQFQAITVRLTDGETASVQLSAQLGPDAVPVAAEGRVVPGAPTALVLQQVRLDQKDLLPQPVRLALTPQADAPSLKLALDRFDSTDLLRLARALGRPTPLPEDLAFTLSDPRLEVTSLRGPLQLGFDNAVIDYASRSLQLGPTRMQLTPGTAWQAGGTSQLSGETRTTFDLMGRTEGVDLSLELDSRQPAALLHQLWPDLALPKTGGVKARLQGRLTAERQMQATLSLRGLAAEKGSTDTWDLASLSATLQATGDPANPEVTAEVQMQQRKVVTLQGTRNRLNWTLSPSSHQSWRRIIPPALWPQALTTFQGLAGTGHLERQKGEWQGAGQLRLATARVGPAQFSAIEGRGMIRGTPRRWSVEIRQAQSRLLGEGLPTGHLRLIGRLQQTGQGLRLTLKELRAKQLEYMSADGLSGLAGGAFSAGGTARQVGDRWQLNLAGDLALREVLHEAFYAKTAAWPGQWTLEGEWLPARRRLHIDAGTLQVTGIGDSRFHGELTADRQAMAGDFRLTGLETAVGPLLAQALQELNPEAASLEMAGAIEGEGRFSHDRETWMVRGHFSPQEFIIAWPHIGLWLDSPDGRLPIHLTSSPDPVQPLQAGHLELRRLSLGPLEMTTDRLLLQSGPNQIGLPGRQEWQLAGGQVLLDDLWFRGGGEPFQLSGGITVKAVQLEPLTREMAWPPMSGRLSADLGRMVYRNKSVRSEGQARIQAFGGRILVGQLKASDLFGAYPGFEADINFNGLDLKALTQTFEFGEMEGIIDGYVRRLRLLGTTPSHFEARVESRLDGPRTISVRALDNLSVVSQGRTTSVLRSGFYKWIPRYNYRKLGIACRLENDRFRIRGIARPGSNRYLVDGGFWPPKIDVVSAESVVSFKELLSRLQRIERSGGERQ